MNTTEIFASREVVAGLNLFLGAVTTTIVVTAIAALLGYFPGHRDGRIFPIYVIEHYGPKNSQHLLDPYSFTHIGYGILSYYVFGLLDFEPIPKPPSSVAYTINKGRVYLQNAFRSNVGLTACLLSSLAFEIFENSASVIAHFREHSGTSKEYRGDSSINVFGDQLSCAFGYNLTKYFVATLNLSLFPLLVYLVMELSLALAIRDNFTLITLQLVYPLDGIKRWQEEIIPPSQRDEREENDAAIRNSRLSKSFVSQRYVLRN